MKWFIACLTVVFIVAPAMAVEDPYIAAVDNDISANPFYFSPKYAQFLYDQTVFAADVCFTKPGVPQRCEIFKTCMDKTVVAKLPVTGQINGLNQTETDLEAGDTIKVRMDGPRRNTVISTAMHSQQG